MAKAQTDIRSTSYDIWTANSVGWQGNIEDVLVQMRNEPNIPQTVTVRESLLMYLGVDKIPSAGPSVELDENPRYGDEPSEEPSFYSLAYALKFFPGSFVHGDHVSRVRTLSESQLQIYRQYLMSHPTALADEALTAAEMYPYPTVRS